MIKIVPTDASCVFRIEIYMWNNIKQEWILTGHHEICCHSEDGTFHSKDLLDKSNSSRIEKQ